MTESAESGEAFLFEGLKVLDVGSWIAGPVAATMLADRGAEVLKVEVPVAGDGYRQYALLPFTPDSDVNWTWAMDARNKRSLSLNLRKPEGKQILEQLIADCDVYITNQPLRLRRELGLEYEGVRAIRPDVIYGSLTAYGETGPDADNEAFDLVAYWNRSGLMDYMRHAGDEPLQALAGMGDHPTAVSMYAGIVTALLKRMRTGEGSKVETSLLANGLWASSCLSQARLANADFAPTAMTRVGSALLQAADDRWLQITMIRTEQLLDAMLDAMGAEDLMTDPRFLSLELKTENAEAFIEQLRQRFRTRTSDEWLALLREQHGLPIERVANFDDLTTDPHLELNRMVAPPAEEIGMDRVIQDPVNVSGVARVGAKKAPELGEHNEEVLQSLGYDAAAIVRLREEGVI